MNGMGMDLNTQGIATVTGYNPIMTTISMMVCFVMTFMDFRPSWRQEKTSGAFIIRRVYEENTTRDHLDTTA